MKADILRRAEELGREEQYLLEEENNDDLTGRIVAFEDELDLEGSVKVRDGDVSGESSEEGDDEPDPVKQSPETILELAYMSDPGLFARDAQTRRSKQRADLKAQTGMLH